MESYFSVNTVMDVVSFYLKKNTISCEKSLPPHKRIITGQVAQHARDAIYYLAGKPLWALQFKLVRARKQVWFFLITTQ